MVADSLGWEISETAHAVRRAFDRRASRLGVTRAQWRVLLRLTREPELRQIDIAEQLDIEPITLCRIIDRLEESGLVERRRDPNDRRAWRLALTASADPLIGELRSLATEVGDEAFGGLDSSQIETLRALLGQVRENLSAATLARASA